MAFGGGYGRGRLNIGAKPERSVGPGGALWTPNARLPVTEGGRGEVGRPFYYAPARAPPGVLTRFGRIWRAVLVLGREGLGRDWASKSRPDLGAIDLERAGDGHHHRLGRCARPDEWGRRAIFPRCGPTAFSRRAALKKNEKTLGQKNPATPTPTLFVQVVSPPAIASRPAAAKRDLPTVPQTVREGWKAWTRGYPTKRKENKDGTDTKDRKNRRSKRFDPGPHKPRWRCQPPMQTALEQGGFGWCQGQ